MARLLTSSNKKTWKCLGSKSFPTKSPFKSTSGMVKSISLTNTSVEGPWTQAAFRKKSCLPITLKCTCQFCSVKPWTTTKRSFSSDSESIMLTMDTGTKLRTGESKGLLITNGRTQGQTNLSLLSTHFSLRMSTKNSFKGTWSTDKYWKPMLGST